MSVKRRVAEKALMPDRRGRGERGGELCREERPRVRRGHVASVVREGAKGAGEAAEKLPDLARKLPEQLTEQARDVTGLGGGGESSGGGSESLSPRISPGAARNARKGGQDGATRRGGRRIPMAIATQGTASNYLQRAPSPSGLADVIDLILDKGLVIDAFVRSR